MTQQKPFWEETYKDLKSNNFGKPSKEIIDLGNWLPKNSLILDTGCGEGRNALYLASLGFKVDAFDISKPGIKKLITIAKNQNIKINAWVDDLRTFQYKKKYDFIISHGFLHLIKPNEWKKVIKQMKNNTKKGGVNVVVVFTDKTPIPPDLTPFVKGIFKEDEIKEYYKDWKIKNFKSYIINDEHPNDLKHTHAINKIIAWKK